MTDETKLLQEHNIIHGKMSRAIDQLARNELYLFISVSAVYAWYFSVGAIHEKTNLPKEVSLFIPPILVFLGYARHKMQISYISTLSEYLTEVEESLFKDCIVKGWENFYKPKSSTKQVKLFRTFLWLGMTIVTLALSILGWCNSL